MSTSVVLPALGESVTEGTVTRWLKQVGDEVTADEPLLEVSTDKVDTEIPSPVSGILQEILVQEDETVEVGAELARVGDGSESPAPAGDSSESSADAPTEQAPAEDAPEAPSTEQEEPTPAPTADAQPAGGSATEVTLPELGESVTEGTVTRWLKQVGDSVEVDEPLLEISTDKVDTEIPSPIAGTLQEILVNEDDTVEVGGVLARIGDGAAAADEPEEAPADEAPAEAEPEPEPAPEPEAKPVPEAPQAPAQSQAAPQESETAAPEPSADSDGPSYVTPLVRKIASQNNIDLATIPGSGIGGRIRKEDVLAAVEKRGSAADAGATEAAAPPAEKPEPSPLRGTTAAMSRLRKVLAKRAVESMQQTAQLTTVVEVDVTKVSAFRDAKKAEFLEKSGNKLSFLPFFALAAGEALQAYPIVNATVDGENIVYPESENLSIAVDTERGLLTPVLRDVGSKSLNEIAAGVADLASRTRENKLKPDELSGGTFTLTNTGSRGALFDTPVVFLPQSAILGTGIVFKRPGVVKVDGVDAIAIRSYVYLTLSYDHRIIDGADAARFLGAIKTRLEDANFESDLGL